MGIIVYSSIWLMQDLYHQPYFRQDPRRKASIPRLGVHGWFAWRCRMDGVLASAQGSGCEGVGSRVNVGGRSKSVVI